MKCLRCNKRKAQPIHFLCKECYAENDGEPASKTRRGGAREGSGRKPTGRTVTTSSINLPPELWNRLDALRGELTRSAWIAAKIKNARI